MAYMHSRNYMYQDIQQPLTQILLICDELWPYMVIIVVNVYVYMVQ
jgi:hypothetical protein